MCLQIYPEILGSLNLNSLRMYLILVKVVSRKGESHQQILRRFRKAVSHSGSMGEVHKNVGLFQKMNSAD